MGLSSIFEVFQLAIGPSTVLTTGALRIGQAFRELLFNSPYRSEYRILIELTGNFSKFGRESNSNQAVISGLGGYTLEESGISIKAFSEKIREKGFFSFFGEIWPFNPESDLVFRDPSSTNSPADTIRFHLMSPKGQPVFQAEFSSAGNGLIQGPGVQLPNPVQQYDNSTSFIDIANIISTEEISPLEYIRSGECFQHRISVDQFNRRMLTTWKLMMANIDRGLKSTGFTTENSQRNAPEVLRNYMIHLASGPPTGGDLSKSAIYALALSEEILNNHPVITAPTCTGSAIVPAVFRQLQERYLFSDEKMAEGLAVSGIFGSLLLQKINRPTHMITMRQEAACSAIIASAGAASLIGGSIRDIENAATMTAILHAELNQDRGMFNSKSFSLINAMMAQSIMPIVDLSRLQSERMIPRLDDTLESLFRS